MGREPREDDGRSQKNRDAHLDRTGGNLLASALHLPSWTRRFTYALLLRLSIGVLVAFLLAAVCLVPVFLSKIGQHDLVPVKTCPNDGPDVRHDPKVLIQMLDMLNGLARILSPFD